MDSRAAAPAHGPADRIALVRGARRASHRLASSWRSTPDEARRRWLATLGLGMLLCLALTTALTLYARSTAAAGALDWERGWLVDLERTSWFSFHTALWLECLGSSAMLMPVIGAGVIIASLTGHGFRALMVLASYLGAKALIFTGWTIWSRARPDFIADGLAVPPSLHSFPSGHTLQTFTVYGVLVWFWARSSSSRAEQTLAWLLLAVLCAAVAVARLRLGTHWPSDVVAGAVIGVAWLVVLALAQRRLEKAGGR